MKKPQEYKHQLPNGMPLESQPAIDLDYGASPSFRVRKPSDAASDWYDEVETY